MCSTEAHLHTKGKSLPNYCARNRKPTPVPNRKVWDITIDCSKIHSVKILKKKISKLKTKDFMLNTSDTCCIYWQWQFLCVAVPWNLQYLFALALSQSSSTWRLGDFISPGDLLPGVGPGNGTASPQAGISTQLQRRTWCRCCMSLEQSQTCPKTVTPWPSWWTSNNSNHRHKTTSIAIVCLSLFPN